MSEGIDFWMIGVLIQCIKTEMKRLSSGYPTKYLLLVLKNKNRYDPIGQLVLIRERLEEIRTSMEKEMLQ